MSTEAPSRGRGSVLSRFFDSLPGHHLGWDPRDYTPSAIDTTLRWLNRVFGEHRYFPVDVSGWEHLPPAPVLVVANHSGGTTIPDMWGLGWAWYRRFGTRARPIHPLAHDMVFTFRGWGEPFARRGILRANRQVAVEALRDHRRDVLVMPGGDVETWRPWRDRYTVRWSGRTGYAKLALRAGVPIVPVACAGAHDTLLVLTDGKPIARALHLHRLARSDVFPIHLSLPWGLGIGPLPHIPIPRRFRYRFGAPIPAPAAVASGQALDPALVAAHDARVRAAMQGLLDKLKAEA